MSADSVQECPTLERLEESAVSSQLDADLARHLSGCQRCRANFDQIISDNELLTELGRAAGATASDFSRSASRIAAPDIAGYEIIEEIHRGGQGVVYKALQTATRRVVAIKVLLNGAFATARQRRRFEREVEIIAEFRHPNIVTLHDCGQAAGGELFLVMEYVDGVTLDDFLRSQDRRSRGFIRGALPLFAQIADALAAAHQRGIIHRDLKPANILVVEDAKSSASGSTSPNPAAVTAKVLDFGLAKDVGPEKGAAGFAPAIVFQTNAGEFHGTIAYAAPEQLTGAERQPHAMAIDVYALGVLLYEMLTGASPYQLSGSLADVVRSIATTEPPRPSTINRAVDDELEAIVLTAMAKQPDRRYRSAGALLDDLRRYLEGRPIHAKRDSGWYVIRKVVARHKAPVGAATAALLMVIAFAVMMTILYRRSIAAETAAHKARFEETQQRQLAERREREINEVAEFQSSVISGMNVQVMGTQMRQTLERQTESIATADDAPAGAQTVLADILKQVNFTDLAAQNLDQNLLGPTVEAIDREFTEPSLTRAMLLRTVAQSYREIGLHQQALGTYRQVRQIILSLVGERDSRAIDATIALAEMLHIVGNLTEAEREAAHALTIAREELGEDATLTYAASAIVGEVLFRQGRLEEAASHLETGYEGLARREGVGNIAALRAHLELGQLRQAQGRFEEAHQLLQSALETFRNTFGNNDFRTHAAIDAYAGLLQRVGRYAEAEVLYREALDGVRRALGDRHSSAIMTQANLGTVIQRQRRLTEAEPYYLAALQGYQRIYGDDHPHTLTALNNLGVLMESQGRLAEARDYYQQAIEGRRQVHGDRHPATLTSIANLGLTSYRLADLETASACLTEALAGFRAVLGDDHPQTMDAIANLGAVLMKREQLKQAEQLLTEALERRRRILGPQDGNTLASMGHLAELRERTGELDAALELSSEALEIARQSLPSGSLQTAVVLMKHGRISRIAKQWPEAEAVLLESHESLVKLQPKGHESIRRVTAELRMLYEQWHEAMPEDGHDAQVLEWQGRAAELDSLNASTSKRPN